MLGFSVAIDNPTDCRTNVFVRLQIKDTNLAEQREATALHEVEHIRSYNNYGSSHNQSLTAKSYHEPSAKQHNASTRFGSYRTGSDNINTENIMKSTRQAATLYSDRPTQDDTMLVTTHFKGHKYCEISKLELQSALRDSESQRHALTWKLKETRSVLEEQNDKIRKIETAAVDNNRLMENLRFKEMEFRKAIDHFEISVQEKHLLQLRNLQLKEDIQERVNALDCQLRNIQKQHLSRHRLSRSCLDDTSFSLSMLREENVKLQQDKAELARQIHAISDEMRQLRSLLQTLIYQHDHLSSMWNVSAAGQVHNARQDEECQRTVSDLKQQLSSVTAARDLMSQEMLEVQHKLHQAEIDKERLIEDNMKTKKEMEDLLSHADTNKIQEEYQQLQTEYHELRHEHSLLSSKHEQLVTKHRDEAEEIIKTRMERDDLLKQATHLQTQLSQIEDSKRQADDQLTKLTSELETVKAELQMDKTSHNMGTPVKQADETSTETPETLTKLMNDFQDQNLLQEREIEGRLKPSCSTRGPDLYRCKSLDVLSFSDLLESTEPSKTQQKGQFGGCFFTLPEKPEAGESSRLQNLISKYAAEK